MKIAVTGKGGAGKTTLSSLLAFAFLEDGREVIAVDANPDSNLGMALGFSKEELSSLVPIAELEELIKERTTSLPGTFKLNPRVDDIPERFSLRRGNLRFLLMGKVKKGGEGCMCPESAFLRSLVSHLVLRAKEVVIMDMDAGIEHMGRGTTKGVDALIVVVEPGRRSIETALSIKKLSWDLGIKNLYIVGNKITGEREREFIEKSLPDTEILGFIEFDRNLLLADMEGKSPHLLSPGAFEQAKKIKKRLEEKSEKRKGSGS